MAKKNMFQRELNKKKLIEKYIEKRKDILNKLKYTLTLQEKFNLNRKLQKFPINSSNIRLRNRCIISGKPRGVFRFFGLSRNFIRDYGHKSLLPGVIDSALYPFTDNLPFTYGRSSELASSTINSIPSVNLFNNVVDTTRNLTKFAFDSDYQPSKSDVSKFTSLIALQNALLIKNINNMIVDDLGE